MSVVSNNLLIKSYFLPLDTKKREKKETVKEVALSSTCKGESGQILAIGTRMNVIYDTTVYKQLEIARVCPIKIQQTSVYPGEYRKKPAIIKRFERVTSLANPNIISLLHLFDKGRGHPGIQQFIGIAPSNLHDEGKKNEILFVMENHFYQGKEHTLCSLLQKNQIDPFQLFKIARQILETMIYLHDRGVGTGISKGGFQVTLDSELNAKLVLMPLGNPFDIHEGCESQLAPELNSIKTIKWRSPETFTRVYSIKPKSLKTEMEQDSFTYGKILQLMVTKNEPYHGKSEPEAVQLLSKYKEEYEDEALIHMTPIIQPSVLKLIRSCRQAVPEKRPSLQEILKELNKIDSLFTQDPGV